ncbi:MAG TPA: hypothetical protein VEL07_08325 [Planctomycetota bacterium]|nr:hypothetical protein [Planctomycetota bacterium]
MPAAHGTPLHPDSIAPVEPGWEESYRARIDAMVRAKTWPLGGLGDTDSGKRAWPALLAEAYKACDDEAALVRLVAGDQGLSGGHLIGEPHATAGSFYKAFSVPGYTAWYFRFKHLLTPEQRRRVATMFSRPDARGGTAWDYLERVDGQMDPIYRSTEFNSENFHWMARMGGLLWAHEFGDAARISSYGKWLDNVVRATYACGRVEWNSQNYVGYVIQPTLVLHDHAPTPRIRAQARAILDWLAIETALHYIDGAQVGPDSRAKGGAHRWHSGSAWPYAHWWFEGPTWRPSIPAGEFTAHASVNVMGWAPWTGYRPPQVAIDIARRAYRTPVGIRWTKPFYALDEDGYRDWRGDTERGRRFEFETLWLERDYTLASLATSRPDGAIGTFSEQCTWRLGVRGDAGPRQVFGNTGPAGSAFDDVDGRNPYEQIGQFRNVVVRAVRGADRMWLAAPSACQAVRDGDGISIDLGCGVYLGVAAIHAALEPDRPYDGDPAYTRFTWRLDVAQLGGLALEVGTAQTHGTFDRFREAVGRTSFTSPTADRLAYVASDGRRLALRHTGTGRYRMRDGSIVEPAGLLPEVWCDDEAVDFARWPALDVNAGEDIVHQPWGSGTLRAQVAGRGLRVEVDPATSDVTWHAIDEDVGADQPPPEPTIPPRADAANPLRPWLGDLCMSWTDRIAWNRRIDMSTYPHGANAFERFEHARDALAAAGGGVLHYPAGTYDFSDAAADGPSGRGLQLKRGVVVLGDPPEEGGDVDGRLRTRFIFPFQPRAGGSVPYAWNLIGLAPPIGSVDDVGIAWIDITGATVWFGPDLAWGRTWGEAGGWLSAKAQPAWRARVPDGTHPTDPFAGAALDAQEIRSGRGRFVVGCVLRDAVVLDDHLDRGAGLESFAVAKFGARIGVYGPQVLVARNVLPMSRRSFTYPQRTRMVANHDPKRPVWEERDSLVLFDYNKSCGIDVNKEMLGIVKRGFLAEDVVVAGNRVFNHGHKGFNLSGTWLVVRDNVNERRYLTEEIPADYAGGVTRYELTLDGFTESQAGGSGSLSDNLSRAFDLAGSGLWVDGNRYHDVGSDPGNDGEGILCQAHGGTAWLSWAVTRNRHERGRGESGYIAGYDVPMIGALIAWNTTEGVVGSLANRSAGLVDCAFVANQAKSVETSAAPGQPADVVTAAAAATPRAPEAVTATAAADHIDIAWADASDDEIGFRVERSVDGGGWTTIAYRPRRGLGALENRQMWRDACAPRGPALTYRVWAIDARDDGSASAPSAAVRMPAASSE